jgi:hypothetical protein
MTGVKGAGLMTMTVAMALGVGCAERPHEYGQQRPPVQQLSEGNAGLQGKDIVSATDQMATDLLSVPELNSSAKQWTIVITNVENRSSNPNFSYEAFSQRLRSRLAALGHGRVALIENRDKYRNLQSKELEPGGEGGGTNGMPPGGPGINPDYGLYITIDEMPNRATSYYLITGTLTNLSTRQQVWVSPNPYEVNTVR